ncbi:MAG TPA: glycogen debranching N-terminal domain-containing protein [Candidatus Binataceae bacterium]|nr:glycogen debranching N-terminal domain-containing protein [Candidatus Binataceae bacterium]
MKGQNSETLMLKGRGSDEESRTVIKVGSSFYVRASSLTSRRATRVLANGESFAVFEGGGDILETPDEPLGFFHRDTRYLSRFEMRIAGEVPYFLNSYASRENAQLRINLSNPDLGVRGESIDLPRSSLQIERNWAIAGAALFHKVLVRSFAEVPIEVPLDFVFGVDFADLFEVRGYRRNSLGQHFIPTSTGRTVEYEYQGLDKVKRHTRVVFEDTPESLDTGHASYLLTLQPGEQKELEIRIIADAAESDGALSAHPVQFDEALAQRRSEIARLDAEWTAISASNESLDSLLRRSSADLTSLVRFAPDEMFMMAGVPWFATLFGRDSILTALFALPFNPALAEGTLTTLAKLQGTEVNQRRDEQPGKIVHEIRGGELAAIGEVPFGRYYGSVDSTPLFLWLLGSYVAATGDLKLAEQLWSNVERGIEWIEKWGKRDGDPYVTYIRETPRGLANQGWKDSFDGISHADGSLARAPIALCEVQGYVYAAYTSLADVARRLNFHDLADKLTERAASLKESFARDFWLDDERIVALALDGDRKPCRVMTSNAGHCLATGLLERNHAEALAERLISEEMFTGWGVRTLSGRERRYNPMSYHNGSLWPHDNAIVAAGLARIKGRRGVARILNGLRQAADYLGTGSLPELFCGFPRDERLGPVPYPVACHPQAWSAASIFMILRAMLGMEIRAFDSKLVMDSPTMPEWLDWLKIENLKVGDGAVSLIVRRVPEGASIGILERRGDVTVEVLK